MRRRAKELGLLLALLLPNGLKAHGGETERCRAPPARAPASGVGFETLRAKERGAEERLPLLLLPSLLLLMPTARPLSSLCARRGAAWLPQRGGEASGDVSRGECGCAAGARRRGETASEGQRPGEERSGEGESEAVRLVCRMSPLLLPLASLSSRGTSGLRGAGTVGATMM
jgi:hypothetical protein